MEKSVRMDEKKESLGEKILGIIEPPMEEVEVRRLNPLVLAYIGDAIFELYIRKYLILTQRTLVNQLHKKATKYVRADAQSSIIHGIMEDLTEEEIIIVKRGRNTKTNTAPKNSSLLDYKYATGFEALLGYHYLVGNQVRLKELISMAIIEAEN